jgi:hypothetical protein
MQSNIMSFRSNFQMDAATAGELWPGSKISPGVPLSRESCLLDCLVTVIDVEWYGSAAIEPTYKDPADKPNVELLYRDREPTLKIVEAGRPWSFDSNGKLFRLVSEAHRTNFAHLFDPLLAIHTSVVDPLPHQIKAVYGEMLSRQPLRFLLAEDPGAVTVTVTRNEILTALNKRNFVLAIAEIDRAARQLRYVRQPFQRELDFGVESVNY